MQSKDHWQRLYSTRASNSVSWFQEHAEYSLRLIRETGVDRTASIIDVGGGASTLVDDLLSSGYTNLSVLDLSAAAIAAAQHRLGPSAAGVKWIEADITKANLAVHCFDVWHDRAIFHFLTAPEERAAYVAAVVRSVKPGGHVIVATFAEDGPTKCSGLPVMRYRAEELHAEFGASFSLVRQEKESHHTPSGKVQQFVYCYCRKMAS